MVHSTWHIVGAQWIFVLFLSLALQIPEELSGGGEQLCPGRHQPWLLAFDPAFLLRGVDSFWGKRPSRHDGEETGPQNNGRSNRLLDLEELTQRPAACRAWEGWSLLDPTHLGPPGPTGLGSKPPQSVRQNVFPSWPLITRQWALSAFCTCFLFWEAMNNETMENSDCGCIFHITSLKRVSGQTSDMGTRHPLKSSSSVV